ncbi:MAG TPA: hypothetical protein VF230_05215 [Acidimicrobiales bacterium]
MTTTRSTARTAARSVAVVLVLAVAFLGLAPSAGAATIQSDGGYRTASMYCNNLTGDFSLFAPFSPAQNTFTLFAVSVDNNSWSYSSWFWTSTDIRHFEYVNGWRVSSGQLHRTLPTGRHTVTGWAYQLAGGVGNWVSLGTCDASNIF